MSEEVDSNSAPARNLASRLFSWQSTAEECLACHMYSGLGIQYSIFSALKNTRAGVLFGWIAGAGMSPVEMQSFDVLEDH